MKKYIAFFAALIVVSATTAFAADFGDLLSRLNSRDFSAEKDTLTGKGGVYVGETTNPHAETVMFVARDEFCALMNDALHDADKQAELSAFILDGIKTDISVETKVWLLHQLGILATEKEVPALAALLSDKEQRVIDAAAAALAKIPGDAALAVLKENAETIPAASSALLSRTAPIPPLQPVENAKPFGLANAPAEEVAAWLEKYDSYDDETKAKTLAALTYRDDKSYRKYALDALASDSEILKRAGYLALEKMATAEDVDAILARLGSDRDLAIRLAGFIVADGFDEALKERLVQAQTPEAFNDLATILVRRAVDIRPEIFAKTTGEKCDQRLALLQMIVPLLTTDDVPALVASTLRIPRGGDHDAAENIIAALCNRNAEPIIALLGKYPAAALDPIICRTGGDAAKKALEAGLASKDAPTRNAALAALPTWADAQFAEKMLGLVEGGTLTDAQTIPLLRAYIRVISLPDDKIGIKISRNEKLANLKKAFALAKRVDEKKLILSRLAANRTLDSLAFAVECAQNPELSEAAYEAIADHAHDTILRKSNPEQMIPAMDLVIEKSQNKELVERVKVYKSRDEK